MGSKKMVTLIICFIVGIVFMDAAYNAYYSYAIERANNSPVIFADEIAGLENYDTTGWPITLIGQVERHTLDSHINGYFSQHSDEFPTGQSVAITYELYRFIPSSPADPIVTYWFIQKGVDDVVIPEKMGRLEYVRPAYHDVLIVDQNGITFRKMTYAETNGTWMSIIFGVIIGGVASYLINNRNELRARLKE